MTTEEGLERLERKFANAKRRNRLALAAVVLTVGGVLLAWTTNNSIPRILQERIACVDYH